MEYILLALLVSFILGVSPVAHKYLLTKYHPITIMMISASVYFSFILLVVLLNKNIFVKDLNKITSKDAMIAFAVSFSILIISNFISYYLLRDHKSSIISALIYSSPVFTLIIAYSFLKERLRLYGYLGIFSIL
jgi:drug/metabolite transporter (DMT)-like permease